jgi:3-mercaptopyruvate sulfurtransferase SseA
MAEAQQTILREGLRASGGAGDDGVSRPAPRDDTENVRIVELDEDVLLYDVGHVPNAVKIEDLNDPIMRDYLDPEKFAELMGGKGISLETTVVFYWDKNNWWVTYALWVFRLFGHDNVKVMDGGHIPGVPNVPWARAVREDSTFKSADELKEIYEGEAVLKQNQDVIAYCRIGERSSHTWFVLTYLLGYDEVKNYDGLWTEWGNAVRAPIER